MWPRAILLKKMPNRGLEKIHTKYPVTKLYHWGTLSFACQKDMMKWTKFYSEKTGNGPGHNTGLTSLHQITTWVIKLRFSRYPCLINCVIKLKFSRYPGLKGIITVIDSCIQMLWHSRLYWRNARLLDWIGSMDFNIFRCHSDSVIHNLNWFILM